MYKEFYRIDSETYPWRNSVMGPSDLRICELELVTSVSKLKTTHEFFSHKTLTTITLGDAIGSSQSK